ncbi:MAG: helix-turn-helix transcriptional regulator [Nitrososphaerales archaeon]
MQNSKQDPESLDNSNSGLSPGEQSILKLLKVHGDTSLGELADILGVSKMAVLKHVSRLEDAGLVQRRAVHDGDLGRPEHIYKLTSEGAELFPRAYSDIALCAISFIEQMQGRDAVTQMLRKRQKELFEKYNESIQGRPLGDRIKTLTQLRDKDGYMAESRSIGKSTFEILEHNCPIAALAEKYGETCVAETAIQDAPANRGDGLASGCRRRPGLQVPDKEETTCRSYASDLNFVKSFVASRNPDEYCKGYCT